MRVDLAHIRAAEKAFIYSPPEQLRNYALSTCLATAFPNSPAGKDAAAAAAGYLELGSGPIEAYGDIVQLAKRFLSRQYVGQADVSFQTMKCIDLYHSLNLTRLIYKYTAAPKKRSPGSVFGEDLPFRLATLTSTNSSST